MKRELVYVEHRTQRAGQVAWMTIAESNKLKKRIEAEHLPLVVQGSHGFDDTNVTMTAAEMISHLVPHRRRAFNH